MGISLGKRHNHPPCSLLFSSSSTVTKGKQEKFRTPSLFHSSLTHATYTHTPPYTILTFGQTGSAELNYSHHPQQRDTIDLRKEIFSTLSSCSTGRHSLPLGGFVSFCYVSPFPLFPAPHSPWLVSSCALHLLPSKNFLSIASFTIGGGEWRCDRNLPVLGCILFHLCVDFYEGDLVSIKLWQLDISEEAVRICMSVTSFAGCLVRYQLLCW